MCVRTFGGHVCFENNAEEGFDEILADFSPSHDFNPKPLDLQCWRRANHSNFMAKKQTAILLF